MNRRNCEKCGAEIILAKSQSGNIIPLGFNAFVYKLVDTERCELRISDNYHVAHFETCPWHPWSSEMYTITPPAKEEDRT